MEDSSTQAIGRRLAQARRCKSVRDWRDLTHAEIAVEARTTPQTVSRWEAGKARPGAASIALAARYFGVGEDWLERGVGMPPEAVYGAMPPLEEQGITGTVGGNLTPDQVGPGKAATKNKDAG